MGRKTEEQAIREYFDMFDRNGDGKISMEEWIQYYSDISTMMGGDQAFFDLLDSTWGRVENKRVLSKEETDHYINLIRERILTRTSGEQEEFHLQKLFKKFDKQSSGMLGLYEFDGMLLELNIEVPKDIYPLLFANLDKNRSGYIEFDEFNNFVLYHPYKK